jgi:HSP20 family protein
MGIGNLVPWRWGTLRGSDDDRPLDSFRTEMDSLHRNIDRLFADAWGGSFAPSLLSETWATGKIMPRLDVAESEKAFQVSVELPGMSDKDVAVTVDGRVLTIRGEKKEEKEKKDKETFRRERAYGAFRRAIELPDDVDSAKIEAKFKDGVLTIELPRTQQAQERVKQIPVKAA